jgi:hypothetical protein
MTEKRRKADVQGARVNRRLGWTTASPVDAKASAPRNFLFHMEQEYAVPAVLAAPPALIELSPSGMPDR